MPNRRVVRKRQNLRLYSQRATPLSVAATFSLCNLRCMAYSSLRCFIGFVLNRNARLFFCFLFFSDYNSDCLTSDDIEVTLLSFAQRNSRNSVRRASAGFGLDADVADMRATLPLRASPCHARRHDSRFAVRFMIMPLSHLSAPAGSDCTTSASASRSQQH